MKRFAIAVLCFFFSVPAFAVCECQTAGKVTKPIAEAYDLIFLGRVDSVSACVEGKATVWFNVTIVYKGAALERMPLAYLCSSECKPNFMRGQEWLMYAQYERYGEARVDVCSRSRRRFDNVVLDMYLASSGTTFDEEKNFIEKEYGRHNPMKEQHGLQPIPERHNQIPKGWTPVWLILISAAALGLGYWLTKKFWKK